jgi:hypothetical protein
MKAQPKKFNTPFQCIEPFSVDHDSNLLREKRERSKSLFPSMARKAAGNNDVVVFKMKINDK